MPMHLGTDSNALEEAANGTTASVCATAAACTVAVCMDVSFGPVNTTRMYGADENVHLLERVLVRPVKP